MAMEQKANITLPDWLGSGGDLFGTLKMLGDKNITHGYIEFDYSFRFSEKFNYPIIFSIHTAQNEIVADGIAFRIHNEADKARKMIDESVIIPGVCRVLRSADFTQFLAQVVKRDIPFAVYLDQLPEKFKLLKFYRLQENQALIFDARLDATVSGIIEKGKSIQTLALEIGKDHVTLPDWLGSGEDLFGTIHIIQSKKIARGYIEFDYSFRFSEKFNYPIVLSIRTVQNEIVADGIAFRIHNEADKARKLIDESVIIPGVCRMLGRADFVNFLAHVVKKDITFALYFDELPEKFKHLKFYKLHENQYPVFNEKLIMKIMEDLDRDKAGQSLSLDADVLF